MLEFALSVFLGIIVGILISPLLIRVFCAVFDFFAKRLDPKFKVWP